MPPKRVERYVNKLLRAGRRIQALALLRIEWYYPSPIEVLLDQIRESMEETMQAIATQVVPVWNAWVETINQAFMFK